MSFPNADDTALRNSHMAKKTVTKKAPLKRKPSVSKKKKASASTKKPPYKSHFSFLLLALIGASLIFGLWYTTNQSLETTKQKKIQTLDYQFNLSRALDIQERIDFWSEFLIQTSRTQTEQLNELAKFSPKIPDFVPLIPEKFDCTTFIETVIALSRSENVDQFFTQLISLRYKDGSATFENRNHFITLDWIPNNMRMKILEDITQRVAVLADVKSLVEEKEFSRLRWFQKMGHAKRLSRTIASQVEKNWKSEEEGAIPFIPLNQFDKIAKHIPHGTVVSFVRENRDDKDVLVSHQGIAIQKGGALFLRHAKREGKLVTVDFKTYLGLYRDDPWKVVGINLVQVNGGR